MIDPEGLVEIGGHVLNIGQRIITSAVHGIGKRRIAEIAAELEHVAEMLTCLTETEKP